MRPDTIAQCCALGYVLSIFSDFGVDFLDRILGFFPSFSHSMYWLLSCHHVYVDVYDNAGFTDPMSFNLYLLRVENLDERSYDLLIFS